MTRISTNHNFTVDVVAIHRRRRELANAGNLMQRTKRREHIQKQKEASPCMDCGEYYPYYVMDYDHVRGEKSFGLNKGPSKSFNDIDAEIEKCDLVCSNCHRKRTYDRGI